MSLYLAYVVSDEKFLCMYMFLFLCAQDFLFTFGLLPQCEPVVVNQKPWQAFLYNYSTCSSLSFLELRFAVCVLVCIICIDLSSSALTLFSTMSSIPINLLKEFFKYDSIFS